MCNLSGADIEELAEFLRFISPINLEMSVYTSTGDRLSDYVGENLPKREQIYRLLVALNDAGTLDLFLRNVVGRYPRRGDLRTYVARICPEAVDTVAVASAALDVQRGGEHDPAAPPTADAPGLQRNVRPHLSRLDLRVWIEKLKQIESQVCRVELGGSPLGTGFLVGPSTVLTNWHVVEGAKQDGRLAEIACRFDYLKLSSGSRQEGVAIPLTAEGVIDESRYSPAELTETPDTPPPTAEELDYALLALHEPAGETRGWISLPEKRPNGAVRAGAPLLIVQHPDGSPMKLALDTDAVIGLNANGTRLRYRTNTEAGSSGSPCFTMDWDLIALHHLGDPAWVNPTFNQGVPAELIRQRIVAQGRGGALGAA